MPPFLTATPDTDTATESPRVRTRNLVQPEVPKPGPGANIHDRHTYRDYLRNEIRARGGNPRAIETIGGDCEDQTATQIRDDEAWIQTH